MKTIDSIAYVIFPVSLLYRSLDREKGEKSLSLLKFLNLYVTSILDFYGMIIKNHSQDYKRLSSDYFFSFFALSRTSNNVKKTTCTFFSRHRYISSDFFWRKLVTKRRLLKFYVILLIRKRRKKKRKKNYLIQFSLPSLLSRIEHVIRKQLPAATVHPIAPHAPLSFSPKEKAKRKGEHCSIISCYILWFKVTENIPYPDIQGGYKAASVTTWVVKSLGRARNPLLLS